jgi:large subunit ribosomal protein L19
MANQLSYKSETYRVGDTINVAVKVKEGEKTRSQIFTGLLIAVRGREANQSFTVRKIATFGIGVERIFPVDSPDIISITKKSSGTSRRANLKFLRSRIGRLALRVKTVTITSSADAQPTIKPRAKRRKISQTVSKS